MSVNINYNLQYCTKDINSPDTIELNTKYNIIINANEGYFFEETPTIKYKDEYGFDDEHEFTLNDNKTIANYTITIDYKPSDGINITAVGKVKSAISLNYGLVTLYKPNSDIMKQINKGEYINNTTNTTYYLYDIAKYITSFKRFYCDIPTIKKEIIHIGPYNTNIECDVIETDTIKIDFGNVNLEEYINYNDDVFIYLPYIGIEKLDSVLILGKVITLEYKVNVFSGDTTAYIKNNDIILYDFNGNISLNIPYATDSFTINNNDVNSNNNILYNEIAHFIIISNSINYIIGSELETNEINNLIKEGIIL